MPELKQTKINAWLKNLLKKFDIAFHPEGYVCIICGRDVKKECRNDSICEKCLKELPFRDYPVCPICGSQTIDGNICDRCKKDKPPFDVIISPFEYDGGIRNIINNFKDNAKPWMSKYVAKLILDNVDLTVLSADYVTYVPSSPKAVKRRGFDHAKLLATDIVTALNIPLMEPLECLGTNKDQAYLNVAERYKNVKNAFKIKDNYDLTNIKDSTILLVDDTVTTGATVNKCSELLKNAGANKIIILSLSRS